MISAVTENFKHTLSIYTKTLTVVVAYYKFLNKKKKEMENHYKNVYNINIFPVYYKKLVLINSANAWHFCIQA